MQRPTHGLRLAISLTSTYCPSTQVRFAAKGSLREEIPKPKLPRSKRRRLFMRALEPLPQWEFKTIAERCSNRREVSEAWLAAESQPREIEVALRNLILSRIDEKPYLAICQILPIDRRRYRDLWARFAVEGYDMEKYGNRVMKFVLAQKPLWSNLSPLLVGNNVIIHAPRFDPQELSDLMKKSPQIVLQCFAMPDRILHATEVQEFGTLPSMDVLPAMTSSLLGRGQSEMSELLARTGAELGRILSARGESAK